MSFTFNQTLERPIVDVNQEMMRICTFKGGGLDSEQSTKAKLIDGVENKSEHSFQAVKVRERRNSLCKFIRD